MAPDQHLFQRWGHSFEEDHDDIAVYRPEGFDFPRARGRDGIEFHADGSYTEWAVGRGDAREPLPGSWRARVAGDTGTSADRLGITSASGQQREVQVVQLAPDRLELRHQPV